MPEPIMEVWVRTRVDGTRSVGLYHNNRGDWVKQERLQIATPEMLECVNAVRNFGDFIAKIEALNAQGVDLSDRFDLSEERTIAHGRLLLAAQRLTRKDAARAERAEVGAGK